MFHLNENELSKIVIGLAIKVHNVLGPGLLEKNIFGMFIL